MAEDFNLSSWWNTTGTSQLSLTSAPSSSLSCSTSIQTHGDAAVVDFGGWSAGAEQLSNEAKQSALGNVDDHPDSGLHLSGFGFSGTCSSADWSQTLLRGGGISLQENLGSAPALEPSSLAIPFKDMNTHFYGRSSSTLHGLIVEPDPRLNQPPYMERQPLSADYRSETMAFRAVSNEVPRFFKSNQLQFTNNAPFWSAATSGFYDPSPLLPTAVQLPEAKPSSSSSTAFMGSGGVREKQIGNEPALKKPRNESTPSPLPAFKVRKEKLGDRITALQQLVSPFGKTDTASVLQEAIDYIKLLHDQVITLSTPYLKNGHPMQQTRSSEKTKDSTDDTRHDLRSRGLCLVPIASTYSVASETTADFWTPTFGAPYR